MPYYKQLKGEKCYLSPIDPDDAEKYCEWLNDISTTMYLDPTFSLARDKEREIIYSFINSNNKLFGIIDNESDKLIGGIGLHELDFINGNATYGIYIGDKSFRGKGYAKEATELILDYGFNILNLNNVNLNVYEYNEKAIRLYEKLGFNLIGRRRKAKQIAGKRYDVLLMDILAEDFESVVIKKLFD